MTDQIVTRAKMRERGKAAFAARRSREDHGMNPGSPAIEDWSEGWDDARLASVHAEPVDN